MNLNLQINLLINHIINSFRKKSILIIPNIRLYYGYRNLKLERIFKTMIRITIKNESQILF